MKISKSRYYRPLASLTEGEYGYLSHEAIKISATGEVYVDLNATIYQEETKFQVFIFEHGEIAIMDYSNHVWQVTDIDNKNYVLVNEYVEALNEIASSS